MSNYITENDNWAPKTTLASTDSILVDEGSGVFKFAALSNLLTYGNVSIPNGSLLLKSLNSVGLNTSDGADDGVLQLSGGGVAGQTRGAYLNVYGNEFAGAKGDLGLNAGLGDNSSDFGQVRVFSSNGTAIATFGDGTSSSNADVSIPNGDLIVTTPKTPATAGATGTVGTIAWDTSYVYVCVATDTWKRSAIATW